MKIIYKIYKIFIQFYVLHAIVVTFLALSCPACDWFEPAPGIYEGGGEEEEEEEE